MIIHIPCSNIQVPNQNSVHLVSQGSVPPRDRRKEAQALARFLYENTPTDFFDEFIGSFKLVAEERVRQDYGGQTTR